MSTQTPQDKAQRVAELAQQAFWAVVAAEYPEITTGDFGPGETFAFEAACLNAVRSWVDGNQEEGADSDVDQLTYRIWARCSGGYTGTREAWLKEKGEIWETSDRAEAETKAAALNVKMNRPESTADFRYTVREAL